MIIWIVSYPKSGNTWVRLFLKKYFELTNQSVNAGAFPDIDHLKRLNIDYKKFINITKNWDLLQTELNLKHKTNYLKTHNALCTIGNSKFTNKEQTVGGIYLIRDPRDVVISYAHHLNKTHEETLEMMINPYTVENPKIDGEEIVKTLMGRWSDHLNSWKSYKDRKILFIKYENLVDDTYNQFLKILNYLSEIDNIKIDNEKLEKSIEETSFKKLSENEKKFGFKEATVHGSFFRKGVVGDWKKNLDPNIAKKLEETFFKEMKELGYL
jgi:hypothetical protein